MTNHSDLNGGDVKSGGDMNGGGDINGGDVKSEGGTMAGWARARWRNFAVGGPLVALALLPGPVLAAWNSLPDPLAMSWRSGEVVNLRTPGTLLAMHSIFALACMVLFVVGGFRKLRGESFNAGALLVGATLTSIFALQSISTVLANSGAASGSGVAAPSGWWTVAEVVVPILLVATIAALFRDVLVASPPAIDHAPSAGLSLSESEAAAWHSGATAPWSNAMLLAAWIVPAVVLVGALFVDGVFWATLVPAVILVVALTSFARVRVSVDRRGLTVRYGWLPWPHTHIGLDSIHGADAAHVTPGEQGGWGYRGSRALLGRAAVVIRAGEGIHLHLENDREFVVTVDDATRGAGVLNDLLASRGVVASTV